MTTHPRRQQLAQPSRRSILRGALSGSAAALTAGVVPIAGLGRLGFAATPGDLRVIVHLRGGCDGLNLVSPANDPDFIAARASELRVEASGADAGHRLGSGEHAGIDFRLHAAARHLAELYDGHALAFVHAAGLVPITRSHFVAIDMIDAGASDAAGFARRTDGWLARLARAQGIDAPTSAVAAGALLPGDFRGLSGALAIPDIGGGLMPAGGPGVAQALARLYQTAPGDVGTAGRAALDAVSIIDRHLPRDAQGKVLPYQAANGVAYEPAGDFGRALRTVAQVTKLDIGLRLATVDIGGWDSHEYQAGRFKALVERLSAGLGAFYNDMSEFHDRLTILVISEFGRRLRSNRSGGTDHGRGGLVAVIGGRIAGGHLRGAWPGLASDRLEEGIDLAVATDYRRIVVDAFGLSPSTATAVFPDYRYPGPLGLLRS